MLLTIVLPVIALAAGVACGYAVRSYKGKLSLNSAESRAQRILLDAKRDAESKRKELLLEAKDNLLQEKNQLEKEMRERRQELIVVEKRCMQKEEQIERKGEELARMESDLIRRERENKKVEEELNNEFERYRKELEKIANLTQDQAREMLLKELEDQVRFESLKLINKIEEEARRTADKKAKEIVVSAIQRNATEYTSENTITTVSLPSDDMKGRIIGREGRNIRTLENLTGVDMIIDDTP